MGENEKVAVQGQEEVGHFEVKGKPNIGLGPDKGKTGSNLSTLLKQKIEEFKEKKKKEARPAIAHPGSEFKPENTPYIPDSTHPSLDKHSLATPERNAGFQDASMVPPMYRQPLNKMEPPKAQVGMQVGVPKSCENCGNKECVKSGKTLSQMVVGEIALCEPMTGIDNWKPKEKKLEPKQPEFTMKVDRVSMHKGGHYMPNESRPYRPGDTK